MKKHVSALEQGDRYRDPECSELITVREVEQEGEYWIVYGETDSEADAMFVYGEAWTVETFDPEPERSRDE